MEMGLQDESNHMEANPAIGLSIRPGRPWETVLYQTG
jgi:hypothetical protein